MIFLVIGGLALAATTALLGTLITYRAAAGAVVTPIHPAAASTLVRIPDPSKRIRANGWVSASALIGVACSYPLFGGLMDRIGWSGALVASGVALMVTGLIWRYLGPVAPARTAKASQEDKLSEHPGLMELLKEPKLMLLGLSYAAFCYFQYLAFFWGNRYVSDILDVAPSTARWIASLMMAFPASAWFSADSSHPVARQSGPHQVQRAHGHAQHERCRCHVPDGRQLQGTLWGRPAGPFPGMAGSERGHFLDTGR